MHESTLGMDAEYITRFRLDPLTSPHFPTFLPLFLIWVLRLSRWLAGKERRYVHNPKTRKLSCIPLDRYINVDRFTCHISNHHLRIASHTIPYHTIELLYIHVHTHKYTHTYTHTTHPTNRVIYQFIQQIISYHIISRISYSMHLQYNADRQIDNGFQI